MYINDIIVIKIMRILQTYKRRTIAAILGDIEQEFSHINDILYEVRLIKTTLDNNGKVRPTEIKNLIDTLDAGLPAYTLVRKIVLDNINDFVRKVFQRLLSDVEGYDG